MPKYTVEVDIELTRTDVNATSAVEAATLIADWVAENIPLSDQYLVTSTIVGERTDETDL